MQLQKSKIDLGTLGQRVKAELIADYKNTKPQSLRIERRHWAKGFIRLGYDVQQFSYA